MCKSLAVKAALLLMVLSSVSTVWGQNSLQEILDGIPQVPEEASTMLHIHNRDVIAYYNLQDYSSDLKQKNFAKTEEYKSLLSKLEDIRRTYYSGKIYVKTDMYFGRFKLNTGKIQAPIPCPADLLGRAQYKQPMQYFDDGHVFSGISFPALPLVLLPMSERVYGTAWYALDLKVSEEVATLLEDVYADAYLIGKISTSKQDKMFYFDYWDGLVMQDSYPASSVTRSVPVVEQFTLVLVDTENDEIIFQKNFSSK